MIGDTSMYVPVAPVANGYGNSNDGNMSYTNNSYADNSYAQRGMSRGFQPYHQGEQRW